MATSALLSTMLLTVPPSPSAAEPVPAGAVDSTTASALARRSGKPVEVIGFRTEHQTVTANPAGTFTLEQRMTPQRVRRADGSWVPVDTTLRMVGGSAVPVAVPFGITLSSGGDGPLFTLSERSASLSLSWPAPLPAPTLAGETATYVGVLPGVDLVVRVSAKSVSHTLVVHSREAAANPALTQVRYGLSSTGVTVSATNGVTRAVNAAGETVFAAPTPRMWDTPHVVSSPSLLSASKGEERRYAAMPVEVSVSALVLRPDRGMLSDPATRWPVHIDPIWTGMNGAGMDWTQVSLNWPNDSYWRTEVLMTMQVGFHQGGWGVNRSFFQFNTAPIEGKQILSAYFGIDEQITWTCTPLPVGLYVTGPISPSTTWNSQPAWPTQPHGTVHTGNGADIDTCPGKRISWGVWAIANTAATSPGTTLTVGMRTPNEALRDPSNWHLYGATSASLAVEFNSYPNAPTEVRTDGKPACRGGADRLRVRTLAPVLAGRLSDVDGGTMPGEFVYQKWTGTAWSAATTVGTAPQSAGPPGSTHQVGLSLQNGDIVRWQMHGTNPLGAPYNSVTPGPWSPWCELQVDTAPPGAPAAPTSTGSACPPFPLLAPASCATGTPVGFSIPPPTGETDVAGYLVGVGQAGSVTPITWVRAAADGTATAQLAPTVSGLNEVVAKTVDRAGNVSTNSVSYRFNARTGTLPAGGPVGWWRLERRPGDPAGDLVDTSGYGNTLTASGGYALADDARLWGAKVGHFDGSTAVAAASGPVIQTDSSFSLSAWVRLTDPLDWKAAVSVDGGLPSAVVLGYGRDKGGWTFQMPANADGSGSQYAATGGVQAGVWTHLAGVYDDAAHQMRLYVNGSLAATQPMDPTWAGTGSLVVGRSKWNGWLKDYFAGDIADVRAWRRAISSTEVAALPGAVEVGRWGFEGECCAVAQDATAFNRTLYLWGGAGYTGGGHSGSALRLDGVSGVAASAAPAVRTDQSFTLSAWARPAANTNGWRSVVAAKGAVNCAIYLRRDENNKWNVTWVGSDSQPTTISGVSGTSTSTVGVWTHVAAVYDAQAKQARLYVNGVLEGSVAVSGIFAATGPLTIGGELWAGLTNYFGPWQGDIDEVRVFQGAMTGAAIQTLHQQ